MNRDSNSYTLIYATVMVILAAAMLAGTSIVLKESQQTNEKIDKMEQILRAVGVSGLPKKEVISTYKSIVKEELVINQEGQVLDKTTGDKVSDSKAFNLNTELLFKTNNFSELPVYVADLKGKSVYILPLNGAGLWGPIWGYLSVDASDHSTLTGADFGNKGETPGLGAEISKSEFSAQFISKQLYKNGAFAGIGVVQPGKPSNPNQDHVDGISGGTLTSNGVKEMLAKCIEPYQKFIETYNNK